MRQNNRVLVTGAGGFIGHHLVRHLKADGYWVRGVDIKHPEFEASPPTSSKFWTCENGRIVYGRLGMWTKSITWRPIWEALATSRLIWPP